MPVVTLSRDDEQARLDLALGLLSDSLPELSARNLLSKGQKISALILVLVILVGLILFPLWTGIVMVGLATITYVAILIDRVGLVVGSLRHPNLIRVSDTDALSVSDHDLPIYTVLVPIYKEAQVIRLLIGSLEAIDYPGDKLDVKLLVERDDGDTLEQLLACVPSSFDVVVVPEGAPRTKPRALNYGLTLARGSIVTIYDAEDIPDPLQLRKAAVAFGRMPDSVACLQARLEFWNSEHNLITRWFGVEYLQWFRLLLPGLAASASPVPLGGTSNHIRREVLESVGAWDPYNVTEDADLGMRLHRAGFRCAVLDSLTWEEANSDYVNWNNQRSRWYKGYLQTWLIHMRHPMVLLEELGWRGWLEFSVIVGGTPILAVLNLAFWALTIAWFSGHVALARELFPTAIYYPALLSFVFGNVTLAYLYIVSARVSGRPTLVWASCLVPLYWLMMGIASLKATWQLFLSRSFWEKTVHGLVGGRQDVEVTTSPVPARGVREEVVAPAMVVRPSIGMGSGAKRNVRSSPHWLSGSGWSCQILGFVVLLFVIDLVALGGPVSAGATRGHLPDAPLSRRPSDGTTLARLMFPREGIDDLVLQGTSPVELGRNLAHIAGSALPGDKGDAVVVGHRDAYGGPLSQLSKVSVGDEAIVETGGGQARYRVQSISLMNTNDISVPPTKGSRLTIVSGAGGLGSSRLIVVQTTLKSEEGVRFTGLPPPPVGRVHVPGVDGSWLLIALVWLVIALAGMQVCRSVWRRPKGFWPLALAGLFVVVAISQMWVSGAHALPITL